MLIVDGHEDLAWNMQSFGRDYLRPVAESRAREHGGNIVERNGTTMLGWPEWLAARVAVIFATLFVAPAHKRMGTWECNVYHEPESAHQLYWEQLQLYHQLSTRHPERFRLLERRDDLEASLASWEGKAHRPQIGLLLLMEGADGIRAPDELERWYEAGLRMIGPAWTATRYAGGTGAPGPFSPAGRALLREMARLGIALDLSHLSDEGTREALDSFEGPLAATHCAPRALLPASRAPERHLPDGIIQGVAARDGVIGVTLGAMFLRDGWREEHGRDGAAIADAVAQVDYLCQLTGSARYVGLGSDFDGGIGRESAPHELDSIADLPRIGEALAARGYSDEQVANIMGGNWLRFLRRLLP